MEEILKQQIHSRNIVKSLENFSGLIFEEHACILLKMFDSKFIFTRLYTDGGIDGYKIIGTLEKGGKEGIEIYSMFGKESWTKSKPKDILKKLNDDLTDAINYAKSQEFILRAWYPVTNFRLGTDIRNTLRKKCKEIGVAFDEELDPKTLITKLRREKIFDAACYFYAVEGPQLALSTYSNQDFATHALLRITDPRLVNIDERFQLLEEIGTTIFMRSFNKNLVINPFELDDIRNEIVKATWIHKKLAPTFMFVGNRFLPEKKHPNAWFFKNEHNLTFIYVPNLYPIFSLCRELYRQLEKNGDYNIQNALDHCYKLYNEVLDTDYLLLV